MNKLIAILLAATFAAVSFQVVAQDKKPAEKKPTVDQCKKDMKIKGCDEVMKQQKK